MKAVLGVVFGLTAIVILPPAASELLQNVGAPGNTELIADFRDATDSAGNYTDRIHSDGLGPYRSDGPFSPSSNRIELTAKGDLYLRIQQSRRVLFEFNDPLRGTPIDDNEDVPCRESAATGVRDFSLAAPPFLLPGASAVPNNRATVITTLGSFTRDVTSGGWKYVASTYSLASMAEHESAFVALNVRFDTVEEAGTFGVLLNSEASDSPRPMSGIVKVTHRHTPASLRTVETWGVESISASDSPAPPSALGARGARLVLAVTAVRNSHGPGSCDLGDFVVPFGLTLTAR